MHEDNKSLFGDEFDERAVKMFGKMATIQQEQQTDATFNDTVNKLQQIGKVADQTTKKVDELGNHVDKLDGKEANININATTNTETNTDLKGSRKGVNQPFIDEKNSFLSKILNKVSNDYQKAVENKDLTTQLNLLAKSNMISQLQKTNADKISMQDKKDIIDSILNNADIKVLNGNKDLKKTIDSTFFSSENYSGFNKIFDSIVMDIKDIRAEVKNGVTNLIQELDQGISKYNQTKSLNDALSVLKTRNQIIKVKPEYEFDQSQQDLFKNIYNSDDVKEFIKGEKDSLVGYKDTMLSAESKMSAKMDQLITIAKQISSKGQVIDTTLSQDDINNQLKDALKDMLDINQLPKFIDAVNSILTDKSNNNAIDINRNEINNLLYVLSKSSRNKTQKELMNYLAAEVPSIQDKTSVIVPSGGKKSSGGNNNSESEEIDQKELKLQKKLLQDAKKKIESEKIKQLSATQTADEYVDQYKNLISSIVAYRSDVEKFRAKFGQESDPISGYPDEYDETKLKESVENIFAQISDYNNKVTMSKSAASNPEKQQQQANDIYDAYKKLTDAISSFENTFGVKFKQDAQIQTSVGKYASIKNGFTSDINDKTLNFVTENKEISDKRVEMDKLMQDVIDFQDKLAPLVAKLKPAIDTEGAEVNKSDLDAFTELVDKIKTTGETISNMNMREAMKSKLGTKAQSKLNGVQTWEEYIKTLNTRTIVDDTVEKDEKKSGEGKGDGNGNGSGASVEEIQKALEPVEGKITEVKNAVEQLDTDLGNKLDTINNTIENSKPDVNLDVDSIYDKFKDDVVTIRSGIEKVASNFDEPAEVKAQDSVKIPEHLSKLIDESADYGYVPVVSREHTNEIREQGYSIGLQIIDEIEKSLMSNIEGSNIASIMRNLQFNEKDSSTNATYSYDPNFVKSVLEIVTKLAAQSKNQTVSIDQIAKELAAPEKGYAHGGNIFYKQSDAMLALETVQDMNDSSESGNDTFDLSFVQQVFENLDSFFSNYGDMFESLADNDDLPEAKQDEAYEISNRLIDAGNKIADQLKISRTKKSEYGEDYSNEEIQDNLINVAKEVYDDLEDLSMSIEHYKTFTGNDKKIQESKYAIQNILENIQNDVISKIVSDNGMQTSQSGKIIEYDAAGDTKKKNIQVTVDKSQINEIIKILDRSIGSVWKEEGNFSKMLSEIDNYIIANRPSDEQSPAEWLKFLGIKGQLIGAQDKIDSDYSDFDSQYRQYQMDDTTKISSQNKVFNAIAKNFDNLSDAQLNMEQLSNPHKLKDILSYLTRIRNVVDAMYFGNDATEFVNDKYSFKYISPINGNSTQYEFDATKDRTSVESGLPQFLEAIDSDIKFLTELSEQIKDKPEDKQPTTEKKSVNAMLSELITQIGELSKKMDQDDNSELIEELKREINPDGGTKLNQESIDALVNKLTQAIPATFDAKIEQSQYQEIIGKIEAIQNALGNELKVTFPEAQIKYPEQSNKPVEDIYDKFKNIFDIAKKEGLDDVSNLMPGTGLGFGKYERTDTKKMSWKNRENDRYSLRFQGYEPGTKKQTVSVVDKYIEKLGQDYKINWIKELANSETQSSISAGKQWAEFIRQMSVILNDIEVGKNSRWTGMSQESTKSLQAALISQGNSIVDAEGSVHTSLENILKLQDDCSAAQEMIAALGKLYTDSNIIKTMGFTDYNNPPRGGNTNFFKQLYVEQNHPEIQPNEEITNTSIIEIIDNNTKALDRNTLALETLSKEGLNLSQDNVSVETEDVLAQIQEIRQTLQATQTATEAAGFKDIADTINNQVIPQIQQKNDNIIAEKKLVDKSVTAEVNRFTELANTIKNKVGEAIAAKNTLLENDLNNTKAIVDQQMEYVRQLVDSIRDMFAMSDNPGDLTKANALILEFKATENLTDDYRKEVADTLVELDKLWNTGKIEEYQNKFIELMHILESHQKQQKKNVDKDELAYLKEEAQQIKDILGYTRGVKGQKKPTLISKEMIDSLGSSVDLLNQIYGAKGKGWRQAQEHEKGVTWQDLRFMDTEDKRYTGATIVNDQDMEDAEFFVAHATKLLDILEKIKNLSVETEIGGMLGNEQYYAQVTNELENRLNSVVGKNYNAFSNPAEDDVLEGFEEVITDAEAQQKAADELEQRLTANGAQTTIVQIIDLLSTKISNLKKYVDGIANETTNTIFESLATNIGAIYKAITLIPEGGMPDLLGSNKKNATILESIQSSIQSIYSSIVNNQQVDMDIPLTNLRLTLSQESANSLVTQVANAISAGEYTIRKFKVAEDTRVASKIQAVINSEDPIVVSKFVVSPQKSIDFSKHISQIIAESGNISLKKFDIENANISDIRQNIETKLNEKPIKLNNWEAGNFKRINNLVAEGVAKSISDDIQKGLDEKKLILKNWEIKGIQAKINEALKQSPVTVEDFKVGNLANAKQDIAKKIGATKITLDENNPIDIAALNVKTITISDEVAQKIKSIPVTVNPTNLDELVTQITDAFEVGTSKVIKLPNQAAYNTQKTNIAELVGEFETVVKSAQDYAEAIYSITDAIKSVFEQSKPTLNEINASVNNMLNGLHLLNGTNQQESKSNTELYYEDLIKNAKNAQMRMQAGNTSVRGEAYISAMNDEYTKLISLLEQAKDGEGEFDSKLASDIKEQRTVISEMENSFKELEKTANEAEKKLAAAEARIAQAAADNLESPYTEEENKLLQDLRDMVARARSNVSQGTSGEINSALREALEMVYENVNTDGLDQSMLDRLREPVVVDYSDPEKYVKEYAESGLKVKEQLEDANSNLVKALTETQREDLSKKYYDFAELLQKIVDGDIELNANTDKEVSAAYKEIMDAFNKSVGKSNTQQSQKQDKIDITLLNKYKKELEKYQTQLAKYQDSTARGYQDSVKEQLDDIERISEGAKNITDDTSESAVQLKIDYENLKAAIDKLKNGVSDSSGLVKYLDTRKTAEDLAKINSKFDDLISKIQVYAKNNSKLTTDPQVKSQFQNLLLDAQTAERSIAEYNRLDTQLSQLKATVANKGLTGRSLGDDIKYIAERIGIKAALSNSIYKVIGYFRQMVATVTELDTGMTALKRVTQETERVYTDFLKSTTKNAQVLGATMSEVVNATTSFSKLGYNLQEAQTLANNAIIYKTVGDIDINTATNDMISTMKAFNMEASQSEHIVDAFDIINNKYAVSAQQVGEGLRNSASALATANNTFEESAAMVTAITEITQDQSSAGSALKTLSMRLRGN